MNRFDARLKRLVLLAAGLAVTTLHANEVDDLAPGHWLRVANSSIQSVAPPTDFFFDVINQVPFDRPFSDIISAWNSAVYDTNRDRLVIWGGGHNNWPGNGAYGFDVNTLSWSVVKSPSPLVDGNGTWVDLDTAYPDGGPVSRHTYDYIEYIPPPVDALFSAGGAALWRSSFLDDDGYLLNFGTGQWETLPDLLPNPDVGAITAYDPIGNKVYFHGAGFVRGYLGSFDPLTRTWAQRGTSADLAVPLADDWTGAIDPVRRLFVAIGSYNPARTDGLEDGEIYIWDLTKRGYTTARLLKTSGATEILQGQNPGIAYDPVGDRMIAWSGTDDTGDFDRQQSPPAMPPQNVYALNLDTATWAVIEPDAANTVMPTASAVRGTYGRFRYVPSKNVFVLYNDAADDVYFLRLSAAPATTVPAQPAGLQASFANVQ